MQTSSDNKRNDPLKSYQSAIENGVLNPDQSQRDCVIQLNNLFYRLLERESYRQSFKGRLHEWIYSKYLPVKGLYLWGGVGRGKTYFVDTFFDCLPFDNKLRLHFHRFMHRVHQSLRENQGDKNPLQKVADNFSNEARIIVFDEFMVNDVADAMILGELMGCLLKRGVTIVATSNIAPRELYKDGLQRQRFLPVIEYLHRFTEVVHLEGSIDYRYRSLKSRQFYFFPLDVLSEEEAESCFDQLARGKVINNEQIQVNDRLIPYLKMSSKVVWFDFEVICGDARSQNDYLFLANLFDVVIITNVRVCNDDDNDVVRRLINLVDIFYDHRIKLVITAETEAGGLYTGYQLAFEFDRTASRLNEMQTGDYLHLKS